MNIAHTTPATITDLWAHLEPQVQQATHLEHAAQTLAQVLSTHFAGSVVLARVFLTLPFQQLPPATQTAVHSLAVSAGASDALTASTPILSLLGTYGQEAAWQNRRQSQGHQGIPLISSTFVGGIPMISRLLKELGVPLSWVDSQDSEILKQAVGQPTNVFFVEEAATATDQEGRQIIVAQEFVAAYGVHSVLGTGEVYAGGQILATILFCRESVTRATAEHFPVLTREFRTQTASLVTLGSIFTGDSVTAAR